ncbi:Nsp1-like C-terminal region-domain-containing protein [Kickxella alabastrina]|uniref:Nsp1-like C-terminal region-domain-containing protein n=1 Tax=Kickxella alabastrina TaxID=61397 RepID=UPI00222002D8|nr:Nsp1-like C-terminal region-domain-containing protein [Kickxella alabastrina]KAI7826713.1 Nsp1-like C-terminal region-domain-containing protein [Kickxella alabastrina]
MSFGNTSGAQGGGSGGGGGGFGGFGATFAVLGGSPKPASAPLFGAPATTASGNLFGSSNTMAATAASKAEPVKASPAVSSTTSLFGAASTTLPSLGTGGGSLFGAKPLASTAAPASASVTASAAPAASSAGFMFGNTTAAAKPDAAAPATTTAASNPTACTGLGGSKLPSTSVASGSQAVDDKEKADSAAAIDPTKIENSTHLVNTALQNKTVEEIARMWTQELTEQTRKFHTQANTVSYWDRALVQQGKRITELYEATMSVESEQAALDQSLEHMESQQKALEDLLNSYEGRVQDIVTSGTKGMMSADEERDHRLNMQLDEIARRLTTLVEDVNGISNANTEAEGQRGDPFAQIVQILNAHLTSLEWTEALQERVKTAQKVYQEVNSAQTSISSGAGAAEDAGFRDEVLTIPGAFVSEQAPPINSSFGTPMSNVRRGLGSSFLGGRTGPAPASPFSNTPTARRGF